jgi:uncharacterized protein (DUF362 family)
VIKNNVDDFTKMRFSRRKFLGTLGTAAAGFLITPYVKSTKIWAYGRESGFSYLAQVAVTQATTYDRSLIKQKIQHLFESIGGIGDVVKAGKKVAIKINLTGGGGDADHMWTHPEVLRAVGELIIDSGVNANDIYIVEALWSADSFNKYGYLEVQQSLGAQMVNLNAKAPYADFITKQVGSNSSYYNSFTMNQILQDVNVYVSIPKMKQHYEAGVTCSLKNQIGIVPKQLYMTQTDTGRRAELHVGGGQSSTTHLPKSICDLNFARPVHLAVVDGVKNARGGEGVWNPTFRPWEDHVLLAGKNPVATDSIAAYLMGNNPEAAKLQLPSGGQCDNYLEMLHQKGMGTNRMNEIEIVGDGAGLVSVPPGQEIRRPVDFQLYQNFPNPFNPSTTISFYLPIGEYVTLRLYNVNGQEIETLLEGEISPGLHELHWTANNLASGTYIYRMQAGRFVDAKKLIYQR